MARRSHMDISSDLQPLLEYIQWYSSAGKPYLLGGQLTVVPPYMHRLGAYEPVPDIEAEPEPEPELELKPKPDPERSYTNFADGSYHPELQVNNYFPGSSGHGYHSRFDIFSPVPPQYNTSLGPYPLHYFTPLGSYPPQYNTLPHIHRITLLLLGRIHHRTTLLPTQVH
ncbi:uncharacterized protein LOC128035359 [Gossypium raimondii]|uniref:uncharacterized protein LOC128035359 n=1 Tax=Gossypium raimondii TaxID=29730 RepID=UPI00227A5ABB|nr:uncharacterized protein LOC128035359 [Gossypium raimondii]